MPNIFPSDADWDRALFYGCEAVNSSLVVPLYRLPDGRIWACGDMSTGALIIYLANKAAITNGEGLRHAYHRETDRGNHRALSRTNGRIC